MNELKEKGKKLETETVKLLIHHYIEDDIYPSRIVTFEITKDFLARCIKDLDVETFLNEYTSDDAYEIQGYAYVSGNIISEEISYCDDFMKDYNDHIKQCRMSNPDFSDDMEDYYWSVYAAIY